MGRLGVTIDAMWWDVGLGRIDAAVTQIESIESVDDNTDTVTQNTDCPVHMDQTACNKQILQHAQSEYFR